ncbi:protein-cysteine N-palmitoyltransferase HHAT isoform X3 [Pristis pectinata]|uniref:protein-cysteine N-palmitoyltransferase HHAT isoform X3 n=1 Tax=Pristis pectinata TaxID=685728 RepID=UPI00223D7D7F|nr:protein-cysteine N-palmitoyltransferase HHAT isoform X3 [Pristis pectinata]
MRCSGAAGRSQSAPLPTCELALYLAVTVGFHLYSFYQVFKVSRIYEKDLDSEFGFEKGFFIWGFKKDPTDFEWSFWTEWVKKLLLWTLLGHVIISQVTNAFFPKFRTWLLMIYGMLACFITVGYKGLAVILLHLLISFAVAQLRVPALSWLCSVLLLYSLQMDSLGKIQMRRTETSVPKTDLVCLLLGAVRIFFWWWLTESMLHFMYIHAIQHQETILESASYWTLGGLGFAHTLFFYLKYLLLYGIPSIIMCLDGIKPPRLPRCTSSLYSFTGTWREFDVGLHRWLVRYIYVPLGGSRHGLLRMMFSSAMAFSFVCYWHGGHSFMLNWAAMNWVGVMLENVLKMICAVSPTQEIIGRFLSTRMQRRAHGALGSVATTLLILSNLVFLCGNEVGKIYWNRTFIQGWPWTPIAVLGYFYCYTQVGIEYDRIKK